MNGAELVAKTAIITGQFNLFLVVTNNSERCKA